MKFLVLAVVLLTAISTRAADPLASLIRVLSDSADPQVQLDVLRGLRDAARGRQQLPMPEGWPAVEERLVRSEHPEVRSLSRILGLTFGSETAQLALRSLLEDRQADLGQRREALAALIHVRDETLPATLRALLNDPATRGDALRALAVFDDPATGHAILAHYRSLPTPERRDALNTLATRPTWARPLLAAVADGIVPVKDLTADVIRQLRSLDDSEVKVALTRVYGSFRDVEPDKQAEIERYKRIYRAGGSTPGDAIRGRTVYARICQQCHTLFDVGARVGPDLTGSNRGDLDYLLQNMIDPNAVIPNEYFASTFDLHDGRVITGLVQEQDDRTLTIATANETIVVPRAEIADVAQSQLSMMPEGLLAPLSDQEFRDLVYYLGRPGQAPMLATADTLSFFFNGRDLSFWQGDTDVWQADDGEIVGRTNAEERAFLRSDMILGDFRLLLKVKLSPDSADSGVYFRAEPTSEGTARGYEFDIGAGQWGQLTTPSRQNTSEKKASLLPVHSGEWNLCEIVAVGSRIRTALNGKPAFEMDDPAGARQGIVAFELRGGSSAEVRFRDLQLELDPVSELVTVKDH
jgi:putative heme-binding domain-containing protein